MSFFHVDKFGVITVDSSSALGSMQEAYKQALTSTLDLDPSTPEGQLITNDTEFMTYAQNNAVMLASSFSVITATGKALDIAAGHWGYYRKQGVATVVNATLVGATGTQIPRGSLVSNGKDTFILTQTVTLPSSGRTTSQFQALEIGAIPCAIHTLNNILTPVTGWESVDNNFAGVQGYLTESDNTFRQRITANWLNIRAVSLLGAIVDKLAQLPNVISVLGRENPTSNNMIIDGITLVPHSVYLNILGGDEAAIAKVIMDKKTLGAATNGDVPVTFYDKTIGYNNTYNITRPQMLNVYIKISYQKNYYTPADVEQNIKDTLMAWLADNPFVIGQTVSGAELAQALKTFQQADLLSVKVGTAANPNADYIDLTIAQYPLVDINNITCVEVE